MTRSAKRIARRIGIVVALGCFVWSLANFRAAIRDHGWYWGAVFVLGVFSPICFSLLARPELDEYRARKKAKKP